MSGRAVVTVLGEDKIGIVANVSRVLAESGANIEDMSQTIMEKLFAMIMLITIDETKTSLSDLQEKLNELGKLGSISPCSTRISSDICIESKEIKMQSAKIKITDQNSK